MITQKDSVLQCILHLNKFSLKFLKISSYHRDSDSKRYYINRWDLHLKKGLNVQSIKLPNPSSFLLLFSCNLMLEINTAASLTEREGGNEASHCFRWTGKGWRPPACSQSQDLPSLFSLFLIFCSSGLLLVLTDDRANLDQKPSISSRTGWREGWGRAVHSVLAHCLIWAEISQCAYLPPKMWRRRHLVSKSSWALSAAPLPFPLFWASQHHYKAF